MTRSEGSIFSRWLWAAIITVVFSGCAGERLHREGLNLMAEGRYEDAVTKLEAAVKEDPENFHFRAELVNKRADIANRLLASAASERTAGRYDEAEAILRRLAAIDPANERARDGLAVLQQDRRHAVLIGEARELLKKGDLDGALAKLRLIAVENSGNREMLVLKRRIEEQQAKEAMAAPTLKSLYKKPVTLEFRDANLKMVFEVLSRTTGINFILDKEVKSDLKTTLFVKQSSLEDAVDLLLVTNQLEKKVLNQNGVLIYPNTPAKVKEYQDLVVKSFYLASADVKQTANMVKTLLKTKDIFIDEKLNLMVMRDTPEAVRLAEKLVAMQDLTEPEVMLEVEVLEVKRTKLLELGIKFPDQLTLAPIASTGSTVTLSDLRNLDSSRVSANLTNMIINLHKDDGDVNLLANPRIRAKNREKAKILIGDRVPVITTTSTATGFVSESVSYVDVGIKLEVEPNIHLQDDVAIKVGLEVSSITQQVRTATGSLTYQIGTRNASTLLQLKDGETQVLAGLINDEDRASANKVPGLGDLPVVGRLFSSHRDDNQKTEIVLSITPRLIRNLKLPNAFAEEFWSGTEANLRTKPITLQTLRTSAADTAAAEQTSAAQTSGAQPVAAIASSREPSAEAGPASINLAWQGPAQAKVGEQFKVALRLKSDGGLRSLPFQVGFDASALQVIEVAEGGFFKQENAKTNFTSNVYQAGGKIFVGVGRSGVEGAKGEDSVAVITFKAVAPKQGEVKVLAATPVGTGDKTPAPALPDPYVVSVGN